MISIAIDCNECGYYYRHGEADTRLLKCPQCGHEVGPLPSAWALSEGCPVCGCRHLYRRKDFNQLAGLLVVVAGAALGIAVSYWFLLVFSLIDLLMYKLVKDVAVCHRCAAEIRGPNGTADLAPFEHHTAEIYQTSNSGHPQS